MFCWIERSARMWNWVKSPVSPLAFHNLICDIDAVSRTGAIDIPDGIVVRSSYVVTNVENRDRERVFWETSSIEAACLHPSPTLFHRASCLVDPLGCSLPSTDLSGLLHSRQGLEAVLDSPLPAHQPFYLTYNCKTSELYAARLNRRIIAMVNTRSVVSSFSTRVLFLVCM